MQYKSLNLKKLQIICYPDPLLKKVAQPVEEITEEISDLAESMVDIMVKSSGIGLAATQLGIPLRIITMSVTGKRDDAEIIINPTLSNLSGSSEMEEGCLSVPNVRANVRRANACTVDALDVDGNPFCMDAVELAATILQHETDHLNGILFIDHLNTVSRLSCRRALKQLEKEYENR
ncbi:MAG: peptide deformylase [Sedimentisphaerales bacterium]|nr:peptide deformylase [Sedimentisphaerales bacterium]